MGDDRECIGMHYTEGLSDAKGSFTYMSMDGSSNTA